ncbi:hypothetical protein [Psittacicella gerlachiana]|uniref:hypothetical protein n=1 Tax=Psittacicella gerlachiana TaxID=2028574 RepID=UPI001FEB22E5|nr:hypothetical protein [Psittacicella gerlachiana]
MAQKLNKNELIASLIKIQKKQEIIVEQMNVLSKEIDSLLSYFIPNDNDKTAKTSRLITSRLIAQVLRQHEYWMMCGEIAEKVLNLQGQSIFVDVGDKHYQATKRILSRLKKTRGSSALR